MTPLLAIHLETLDLFLIIAFLAITIFISIYYAKRAGKSLVDFFLSGRNLPWYIAGISMVATTFAADTPLAVTELVRKNGISGNWLWWNGMAGGMLTCFLFAHLWRRANILTEVEFISIRYGGIQAEFLRGFKSVYFGIFINAMILGWVNLAMSSVLEVFFDLSRGEAIKYIALAMIFVAIYSALSGLWGVVITDIIQFVIAMVGSITLAVIVLKTEAVGGISGLKEQLSGHLSFFPSLNDVSLTSAAATTLSIGFWAFFAHIIMQWWASWYPGAEPGGGGYIAQRMMSTKNEKHSTYATLFFQLAHYCLRPWPWIIVGLCTIILYPDLAENNFRAGYVMAMRDYLPVGLKGLLLVTFFAAYMSTVSTQLNWGASYIVNDLYKPFIAKEASEKRLVLVSRITTLALMGFALWITTLLESITGVWIFLYEAGAGLGLVLILRWYWWRINAWTEITASLTPFVFYAISRYVLHLEFPQSYFLTVGATTVAWVTIMYLTKPESRETLESFYKRVLPEGFWSPVKSGLNIMIKDSRLPWRIASWLSAIVLGYSVLFLIGKMIFHEWDYALLHFGVALAGLTGMIFSMSKQSKKE